MQLSVYSDYAFRVLMHAALRQPERVTVSEVAGTFRISRHHVVKVVHDLGRHGYLRTRRGSGGGFTLGRPQEKIRLGDVVRLGEGRETLIDCVDRLERPCRLAGECRLKRALDEAAAALFAVLDRYTLADLVHEPARMSRLLKL